uniref:RRM domain-containing protein n=1 Tax=Aegilops tauschii subsp. strangulata TaxID=200361 RepID=A0A453RKY6_AEGTS
RYVGNVHPNVTESLLIEVFQGSGPVERCKLIRKEKSSFGFVDYYDRRSAALAIMTLHGRHIYGQAIKVNWAYASTQREDTSGHFHIFVGDLSSEVNDATLYACFSTYPSCSDARVMWDNKTGRSRGYGFVSFRNQQEAETAITEMTGKWLGSRQIRCNWATKTNAEEKQETDNHNAVVLTNGGSSNAAMEANQDTGSKENPENNPDFTTVYVGNLGHEVNRDELHRHFYNLGVGAIEEVRVQQEKGFGFIRYSTHGEAALAIQMANGLVVRGKPIKCSWGNKPTPPGTSSKPLPPPIASYQPIAMAGVPQGFTAAELLAYQRQLALSQAAAGQIAGQHGLAGQVSAGLLAAGSQALYDGYPSQTSAQQLMYYN